MNDESVAPSIDRLQEYFRRSARERYDSVSVPGFSLFFHPTDDLPYYNYAIPGVRCDYSLETSVSLLRDEFAARRRRPRLEYIHEYRPLLARALPGAGFREEARQQLMVCTARTSLPAREVIGLTLAELTHASGVGETQEFLAVQRRAFGAGGAVSVTESDAEDFLRVMGTGRAFVSRMDGQPVGVGMYTAPLDSVTEIVGLATLEGYRRRGMGSQLTAHAVQRALAHGAEVVVLVASEGLAARMYERLGFAACATMLAYTDTVLPGGQQEESS